MTRVAACQGENPYNWKPINIGELTRFTDEPMGTKEKWWYHEPTDRNQRWLFKEARVVSGDVRGEDWAECLVHVIAEMLGIPSACVALATDQDRRGVLLKSVVPPDADLTHGNELMARRFPGYDKDTGRENPNYTVSNIAQALDGYAAPHPYRCWPAFDVFASYLLLDALVAGRDRHHENWAIISVPGRVAELAPSYDHGNALAFAERPARVEKLLTGKDALGTWLEKGRSHHFAGRPKLTDLAAEGLRLASPASGAYFMQRLHDLCLEDLAEAAERMPSEILSEGQRRLLILIVSENRRRLEDAIDTS